MGMRGDVEAELAKISETISEGNKLVDQLMPRRKNVAAVRGWRLNIRANLKRLMTPQTKRLSDDEYNILLEKKEQFNSAISAMNLEIENIHDVRIWESAVALFKAQQKQLIGTPGFDTQNIWKEQLDTINRQVNEKISVIEQYEEGFKEPSSEENLSELTEMIERRRATDFLVAKEGTYTHKAYVTLRPWEEIEANLEDVFQLWDNMVHESQSGEITNLRARVDITRNRIAMRAGDQLADLIVEYCYFPGNPRGNELESTSPRQKFLGPIRKHWETVALELENALKRTDKKAQIRIKGELSDPQAQVEDFAQIPPEAIERLTELTHGPYLTTLSAADEINAYADQYGTLPLDYEAEIVPDYDALIKNAKQLIGLINSFSGEFNSKHGQMVVSELKSAAEKVEGLRGYKERRVSSVLSEFEAAGNDLKDWIHNSWYQFGGQPVNHKSAGSGDSSQVTFKSHIGSVESSYQPKD